MLPCDPLLYKGNKTNWDKDASLRQSNGVLFLVFVCIGICMKKQKMYKATFPLETLNNPRKMSFLKETISWVHDKENALGWICYHDWEGFFSGYLWFIPIKSFVFISYILNREICWNQSIFRGNTILLHFMLPFSGHCRSAVKSSLCYHIWLMKKAFLKKILIWDCVDRSMINENIR